MVVKCCMENDGPRWGWVVTFSGFWINMFMFGVFRSAGVFYVALMQTFHCTYAEAAWPGSLVGTAMCLIGPIAGLLGKFFSTKSIVSFGVILGAVSVASCFFATNISHVAILFGGGLGIGIGLSSVLLPLLINNYFNRQKATAVGISYCGSTVGAFLFPILVNIMEDEYATRGTFLFLGGLVFHGLWGSMLLQPAEWHKKPEKYNSSDTIDKNCGPPEKYSRCGTLRRNVVVPYLEENAPECSHVPQEETNPRVYRMEIDSCYSQESLNNNTNEPEMVKNTEESQSCCRSFWKSLKESAKIFKNIQYLLTTFSYVASHNVFVTIMIVLPDYAMDRGVPKDKAIYLLSAYAISDFLGRLMPGFLSYRKILRNRNTLVIGQLLLGIALILPPATKTFVGFLCLTLMYGLTGGVMMVLPPVLVAEYVGVSVSAIAYGFSNFFNGAVSLFRPTLIDHIKETTGKYDSLFIVLGIFNLVSVSLWLLLFVIEAISSCRWCGIKDRYYTTKT